MAASTWRRAKLSTDVVKIGVRRPDASNMNGSDGEQAQRGDLTLGGLGEGDGAGKSSTISSKKAIADSSEGGESASSAHSTPSHVKLVEPDQGAHQQGA